MVYLTRKFSKLRTCLKAGIFPRWHCVFSLWQGQHRTTPSSVVHHWDPRLPPRMRGTSLMSRSGREGMDILASSQELILGHPRQDMGAWETQGTCKQLVNEAVFIKINRILLEFSALARSKPNRWVILFMCNVYIRISSSCMVSMCTTYVIHASPCTHGMLVHYCSAQFQ